MKTQATDDAIDEIVATCNGDIRGALKALMLVNEHLEAELQQLYAAVSHSAAGERGSSALH
jgi:replication-associated recombination protein RarA